MLKNYDSTDVKLMTELEQTRQALDLLVDEFDLSKAKSTLNKGWEVTGKILKRASKDNNYRLLAVEFRAQLSQLLDGFGEFISVEDTAKMIGIPKTRVVKWIEDNILQGVKFDDWKVQKSDVELFLVTGKSMVLLQEKVLS